MQLRYLPYTAKLPFCLQEHCTGKVLCMTTPQKCRREAIGEFKTAYREGFHENLSDGEVNNIAVRLLLFFGVLRQSTPGEDQEE